MRHNSLQHQEGKKVLRVIPTDKREKCMHLTIKHSSSSPSLFLSLSPQTHTPSRIWVRKSWPRGALALLVEPDEMAYDSARARPPAAMWCGDRMRGCKGDGRVLWGEGKESMWGGEREERKQERMGMKSGENYCGEGK